MPKSDSNFLAKPIENQTESALILHRKGLLPSVSDDSIRSLESDLPHCPRIENTVAPLSKKASQVSITALLIFTFVLALAYQFNSSPKISLQRSPASHQK